MIAFVLVERRGENPMFDLALFRKPTFTGASIVAFALSASMFAMFLYITLYLQSVLGFSPLETGLRFLPFSLLSFFVAPLSGKPAGASRCAGSWAAACCWSAAGLVLMHGVTADSEWTTLLLGFILAGAAPA